MRETILRTPKPGMYHPAYRKQASQDNNISTINPEDPFIKFNVACITQGRDMASEYFSDLVDVYRNLIRSIARHRVNDPNDVDDIESQVLMKLYQNGGKYTDVKDPGNWLAETTWNLTTDLIRARYYRGRGETNFLYFDLSSCGDYGYSWSTKVVDPFYDLIKRETLDELNKAVKRIAEPYRKAIELLLFGYSYEEIAAALKIPLNTVRSRISQGKVEIGEFLWPNSLIRKQYEEVESKLIKNLPAPIGRVIRMLFSGESDLQIMKRLKISNEELDARIQQGKLGIKRGLMSGLFCEEQFEILQAKIQQLDRKEKVALKLYLQGYSDEFLLCELKITSEVLRSMLRKTINFLKENTADKTATT